MLIYYVPILLFSSNTPLRHTQVSPNPTVNDLVCFGLPSCNHQSIDVVPVMITLLAGAPRLPRVLVSHLESLFYPEHICPCELGLGLPPNDNLLHSSECQ
jgi:hypothetical protein